MRTRSSVVRLLTESLERRRLLASAGTLLQYDFNTAGAWPQATAVSAGSVTAVTQQTNVGTVDVEGGTTKTGAMSLTATAATGGWTSALSGGRLAVANPETNLGKLTLAFNLSASQALPVKVVVTSYTAQGQRTGAVEKLIYPAAANCFQHFAVDLSTMSPSGGGTFSPTAPFVSFNFEIGSVSGWTTSSACQVRVDNP